MAYEITLPKDDRQCEEALKSILAEGRARRNVRQTDWWLLHYFMAGARSFSSVNYSSGEVIVDYTDNPEADDMFRYDDLVVKFQTQLGRMLKIDLSPRVTKKNVGLEDLRKASTGQMVLSMQYPPDKVSEIKNLLCPPLLKYGKMGLVVWVTEDQNTSIDVVPPWELLPIPPNPRDEMELGGLIRERKVPIGWVKSLPGMPGSGAKVWDEMVKVQVPVGQISSALTGSISMSGPEFLPTATGAGSATQKDQTKVDAVEYVEVWIKDNRGKLKEYIVTAGTRIVKRISYDDSASRYFMPISTCGDIPSGGFWGRSFCSTLLPINIQTEDMLARLYENLANIDAFGILCIPTSMGVPPAVIVGKDGLKKMMYEPNPIDPTIKPFHITPANSGSGPVEGLKVGLGVSDRLANQPSDLMRGDAPGRVDSGPALGFLMESSNTPISPTAESIANAITNCYKAALDLTRATWTDKKLVSVSMLDDSLAGVRMDPATGMVSLEKGQIPGGEDVIIGVQSMYPRSEEKEKMELMESLKNSAIDMQEYQIMVRIKGLSIPVGGEIEWQNYRRAMLENIMLFGDGQTAGSVVVSKIDLHAMHLKVLQGFMSRPEYYMATPQVREKFDRHYEAHQAGLGVYPEQLPSPEDAASEQDMMSKLAGQMPPMAGGQMGPGQLAMMMGGQDDESD